jgi:hypothetical protein
MAGSKHPSISITAKISKFLTLVVGMPTINLATDEGGPEEVKIFNESGNPKRRREV